MKNDASKRKLLGVILGLVVVALIITLVVVNANKNNNQGNTTGNTKNNTANQNNYTVEQDGTKVNTSKDVSSDKKVGNVVIEQSKIIFEGGLTKLTSKVTNNGDQVTELTFTVKFVGNDGKELASTIGYVGTIKKGETRYINSSVTGDYSNAKSIVYEIKK
ncbi:MAG: FxLYD domain-containing protein [Clostridia bacterium]|nr:FxLYD domain-containing protein [Clostridia bacterium]